MPTLTGKNTGRNLATLEPKHLQAWLKRFREAIRPLKVRFFACGEYGENTHRPHYHVIIFGHGGCSRLRTDIMAIRNTGSCCKFCDTVLRTWGHGHIYAGELNEKTANYVCGYVLKKLNGPMADLYDGRYPDFARMSLRPGIGRGFAKHIATAMRHHEWQMENEGDVPTGLKHGKKPRPLGSYLRRAIREELGREKTAPLEKQLENSARLLPVRLLARSSTKSVGQLHAEATAQEALNKTSRVAIYKTRDKI